MNRPNTNGCRSGEWSISASAARKAISIGLVLLTLSCGDSPGGSQADDKASEGQAGFSLTYEDVMEFHRGKASEYPIDGEFYQDSSSVVAVEGLPDGATYADGVLRWQPACELKPSHGDFQWGYLIHRIRISLKSQKTDALIQRPGLLVVHMWGQDSNCEE